MEAIITLRSGREIEQPVTKTNEETIKEKEAEPVEETRKGEELEPEHIFLKEDSMKHCIPPPFPQALRSKKKASQQAGILEVLRQVKVNIPLLDIIKQVPCLCKVFERSLYNQEGIGH